MGYGTLPMLLASDGDVDFSIHHLVPYEFMGTTVYITTSHVCMLIIMIYDNYIRSYCKEEDNACR